MEEEVNEDFTPQVFRNKVVLREMFKYLPTSALISSCSLVNRLWLEEARSFIRNKRECTVTLGVHISAQLGKEADMWKQLCELDSVVGNMDNIPFNSLRVVITESNHWCKYGEEADKMILTNLMSRFPLKYLSVFEKSGFIFEDEISGSVASAILELIEGNCSTLLEFEIRSHWQGISRGFFTEWEPPRFNNLKKLSVAKGSSLTSDCVKKIIRGASNLTGIHNNCLHMIPDVIPENMYRTLKRLAFHVNNFDRIEKFAGKLCHLEQLVLAFWSKRESAVAARCIALFRKLLTLNSSTLCSLGLGCLEDLNLFNQLQLPLLPSVKDLCFFVETFEGLYLISVLNFRESLPNLYQVHIREPNVYSNDFNHAYAIMVSEEDVIIAPNASETTMELAIEIRVRTSDLLTLRSLFPNVIKLSFTSRHFPPLGLAGFMWPKLQSLSVYSGRFHQEIVGAQVFGIHPKEWKLLRQQDKQVLNKCQLVPSRPCVLTMTELKHFQLEYRYRDPDDEEFLRLLEPLVVGRMPGLSFKMKQFVGDPSWTTPRFGNLYEDRFHVLRYL